MAAATLRRALIAISALLAGATLGQVSAQHDARATQLELREFHVRQPPSFLPAHLGERVIGRRHGLDQGRKFRRVRASPDPGR